MTVESALDAASARNVWLSIGRPFSAINCFLTAPPNRIPAPAAGTIAVTIIGYSV